MKMVRFKSFIIYTILFNLCTIHVNLAQNKSPKSHISVIANNKSFRHVLQDIMDQSNVKFVFDDELVDGKTISCRIINCPVEKAIRQIMDQIHISFEILPIELVVLYNQKSSPTNNLVDKSSLTSSNFIPTHFTLPTLQEDLEPDYPHEARKEGLEGSVEMNMLVNDEGDVKQTIVIKSSGYQVLDDAAVQFAKKLKYNPAKKQGKPIDVWVSRVMHYQLVERFFLPTEYIDEIQKLTRVVDISTGSDKNQILREILNCLEEFAECLYRKSDLNYNRYIEKIIQSDVYEQWKDFWNDWPLYFLVFHDFLLRYPDSESTLRAKNSLLYFMHKVILHIEDITTAYRSRLTKREIFLQNIDKFLRAYYPDATEVNRRAETLNFTWINDKMR